MSFENWDFSCPDWEARLADGRTPIPELPLAHSEADAAVKYFNKLRIPDVIGQPTLEEAGADWFRDIVRAAFGSVDVETGARAIEEIFVLVPKKNAKTTNSAALGIVWLLMNRTPNVEGVIIGPTQDVADTCFRQAVGMIEADPYLAKRFHVVEHKKTIIDLDKDAVTGRPKKAKLKVKSFAAKVVTGTIPAFAIIDELHVMAEFKDADRVLGQITGGAVTDQPTFIVYITTQSERPPVGVFKQYLKIARGVRDGRIKGNVKMLPVIYEFPEAIQTDEQKPWMDPRLWPMVLPNLGRSVLIEKLLPKFEQAREKGIEELARWASQHLNIEIGLALHAERWLGADYWPSCADETLSLERIIAECEVITAGFDGGGLDDLAGLAITGRHAETQTWMGWFRAWAHPKVFERRPQLESRLRDFEEDGDLIVVERGDPLQIFREVVDIMVQIRDAGKFPKDHAIGLDQQAVADLVSMLADEEFSIGSDGQVVGVPQGWQLSSAIWGWEMKLDAGTYRHCGQPMMNWVLGNAKAELKGKNIYITKQAAGKAKIDPLTAGFNSYQLMARNPEAAGQGSVLLAMEGIIV